MRLEKAPPPELKRWDKFKRFHWGINYGYCASQQYQKENFTLFDTGEVICHVQNPDPNQRRHYPSVGVTIISTKDDKLPQLLTPEGEKIPKTWFGSTQQALLIDHDTKHVVSLAPWKAPEIDERPDWVRHIMQPARHLQGSKLENGIYYAGEGAIPMGGPIHIYRPWRKTDRKAHIQGLIDAQKMHASLTDAVIRQVWKGMDGFDALKFHHVDKIDFFNDLDERQQRALFWLGVGPRLEILPYMLVA